jgi:TonB family protein
VKTADGSLSVPVLDEAMKGGSGSQNVPPTLLEGYRTRGSKLIVPDDDTKLAFQESGKDKLITSYKLCVDTTGAVDRVSMLKTSGYPAYDAKIMRAMKGWGYRPYLVNGKAVPVCTAVTFIYSQK